MKPSTQDTYPTPLSCTELRPSRIMSRGTCPTTHRLVLPKFGLKPIKLSLNWNWTAGFCFGSTFGRTETGSPVRGSSKAEVFEPPQTRFKPRTHRYFFRFHCVLFDFFFVNLQIIYLLNKLYVVTYWQLKWLRMNIEQCRTFLMGKPVLWTSIFMKM